MADKNTNSSKASFNITGVEKVSNGVALTIKSGKEKNIVYISRPITSVPSKKK